MFKRKNFSIVMRRKLEIRRRNWFDYYAKYTVTVRLCDLEGGKTTPDKKKVPRFPYWTLCASTHSKMS